MADEPKKKLGEILVARGLAAREEVAAVLASPGPGRLASELYRLGITAERELAQGLAEQHGHPAVVLSESSIDLEALDLVPRAICERYHLLPVAVDADTLTVAAAEVSTAALPRAPIFDQIELASGRRVLPYLVIDAVVAEAIPIAYEARAAGETTLVGHRPRPSGVPAMAPLAVVRAPTAPIPLTSDPLFAPSDAPPGPAEAPITAPVVVGTMLPDQPVVLVVEDDPDVRALLHKVLGYDGYHVLEAATGGAALQVLRTERPACILLDAMLPEVHGFDICATLKRSPTFAATPVIVVSAVYRGWEHARTVQETHGADAFVEKPFDVHYVRQLVARMVGRELPRPPLTPQWQQDVRALAQEAEVAYRMGDLAACEDASRRWRALDPFDAHAWLILGNARSKAGDPDGAMKAWERAATFDGHLFPAFKNLAAVYEQLGFAQRAAMAWSRAHDLAPDPDTRRRIAERLALRRGP
ncbi:MAG: response regulator [Deltaproteobacteria bacterium]|nr:response regulator [Deltaproteobacteria bacterium]